MVDKNAVTTEQNPELPVAKAPVARSQLAKSRENRLVGHTLCRVAERTSGTVYDFAGPLLADSGSFERPHRFFSRRGPRPFFSTSNL
jgi:hypothetical protein